MFLVNLWVLQYMEGKVIRIRGELCGTNQIREVFNGMTLTIGETGVQVFLKVFSDSRKV